MSASIYDVESKGFLPADDPVIDVEREEFVSFNLLMRDLPRLLEVCEDINYAIANYTPRLLEGFQAVKSQLSAEEKIALRRDLAFLRAACVKANCKKGRDGADVPESVAAPLEELSREAGVQPTLNYYLYILNNFWRPDPQTSRCLGNMRMIRRFTCQIDEEWFATIHWIYDLLAGEMMEKIIHCHEFAVNNDVEWFVCSMNDIAAIGQKMTGVLLRLGDACHPILYFNNIRPYQRATADCEIGAQNPFYRVLDVCFGVQLDKKAAASYRSICRQYFTPKQIDCVKNFEAVPPLARLAVDLKDERAYRAYNYAAEAAEQIKNIQKNLFRVYVYDRQMEQDGGGMAPLRP